MQIWSFPPLEKALLRVTLVNQKLILRKLSLQYCQKKMAQQTVMNGPAMDGDHQKTEINSQSLVRCFVE